MRMNYIEQCESFVEEVAEWEKSVNLFHNEGYVFSKMELKFQQALNSDYLRNNKTNGSKNLRRVLKYICNFARFLPYCCVI